jgi:hypothetical protein
MVVTFMNFKMFGQISNPFAEKSDLNLGRTSIPFMALKLFDDLLSLFLSECHVIPPFQLNVIFCRRVFLGLKHSQRTKGHHVWIGPGEICPPHF